MAPSVKVRAGDVLDSAPKVVCGKCNSTWMSGIQNRAKPYLIPLFDGHGCFVDARVQALIASWIAVATMTAEFSNNNEAYVGVPQADRDWIRETQTVPNGWCIWIGRHKLIAQDYRWIHTSFPILDAEDLPDVVADEDRVANSQTTKFTIGELFFFSFSSLPGIAEGWNWQSIPHARNRLVRIFPHTQTSIFWPPPAMSDSQAIEYGHAYLRYSEDLAKRRGYR